MHEKYSSGCNALWQQCFSKKRYWAIRKWSGYKSIHIVHGLELSVTFNEISLNNFRERDAAAAASETVKTIIKIVIVGDRCPAIDAPRDATVELYNHADRIRSNAVSAHSRPFTQWLFAWVHPWGISLGWLFIDKWVTTNSYRAM
nr:hypothetical protein [Providencia sp. R33]